MTTKVLATYPDRCVGCRICEQWCSLHHGGAVNPALSRIIIHGDHRRCVNLVVACSQCAKAPCVTACPAGALRRNAVTGGLDLDPVTCIGCRLCLEACPRGVIRMDADAGTPLVCDLCDGDPQCAKHCAEGAVQYLELERVDQEIRRSHLARAERARRTANE
jgi:anaerobic carbon-monoxide dehydrogenase iron sulfur subunit